MPGASTVHHDSRRQLDQQQQPAADDRRRPPDRQQDDQHRPARVGRADSGSAFSNRGVDFTNRAADLNPEDIEIARRCSRDPRPRRSTASTRRTAPSSSRRSAARPAPADGVQQQLPLRDAACEAEDPAACTAPRARRTASSARFGYFGAPYAPGTKFYDNIDGFFQTAMTQKHNLSFSGGAPDNSINYRLATSSTKQRATFRNASYVATERHRRVEGAGQRWLKADLSMAYTYATNDQPFKGDGGPLIGLLVVAADRQREGLAHARRHAPPHHGTARSAPRSTIRTSTSRRTRSTRRTTASSRTSASC